MTRVANIRLKLSDFIETDLEDIIMSRIKTIEQKLSMKFVLYFWLDTDINLKAFYDRWKDNLSIKTIIKNDNSLKANEFIFFDIAPSDINYNSNVRFQTKYNYIEEIPMMLNQMYDVAKFTTRSQEMKPQKRNDYED
jgi:mRNA-degrading endonuclease HigB of HigAB toxin-antitoxin module